MTDLHLLPGCRIREITRPDASNIQIAAEARQRSGRCPDCGEPSHAVHSRTVRRPADLPCLGRQVRLELAVRRLYCRNAACSRRTFVERLPGLIALRALSAAEIDGKTVLVPEGTSVGFAGSVVGASGLNSGGGRKVRFCRWLA